MTSAAAATVGRPLVTDAVAERRGFFGWECARRRAVLRETLAAFEAPPPAAGPGADPAAAAAAATTTGSAMERYHQLAAANLARWRAQAAATRLPSSADTPRASARILVLPGDWGEVTRQLTVEHGACFAVLNMANAFVPGGAYTEGAIAMEENLFRRTDCHFRVGPSEYDADADRYLPAMTRLISAEDGGRVYLDTEHPRVCIRGPEDRSRPDLGYAWLADDEIFPFFELRSAAQDLRGGLAFDEHEGRKRIAAQLDTLAEHAVRHVVLSAFGCGAFQNPAPTVARLYREELSKRLDWFSVVAFAIFSSGYGPNNFTPFAAELRVAVI